MPRQSLVLPSLRRALVLHRSLLLVVHSAAALRRERLACSSRPLLLLVLLLRGDHAGILEDLPRLRSSVLVRVDRSVRVLRRSSVRLRVALLRARTHGAVAARGVLLRLLPTATARGHTLATILLNGRTTGVTHMLAVLAVLRRLRVAGRVAVRPTLGHARRCDTRRVLGALLRLARGWRTRTTWHRRRTRLRLRGGRLRVVVLLLLMMLLRMLMLLLLHLLLLLMMRVLLLLGWRLRASLLLRLLRRGLMVRRMLGRLVVVVMVLSLLLLLRRLLLWRRSMHLLHLRLHSILRSTVCCFSIVGSTSLWL